MATGSGSEWRTRDRLLLTELVEQTGTQNWAIISRHMRSSSTTTAVPEDYFSAPNCAGQFTALLEAASTPRRNRRDSASEDNPTQLYAAQRKRFVDETTHLNQQLADEFMKLQQLRASITQGKLSEAELRARLVDLQRLLAAGAPEAMPHATEHPVSAPGTPLPAAGGDDHHAAQASATPLAVPSHPTVDSEDEGPVEDGEDGMPRTPLDGDGLKRAVPKRGRPRKDKAVAGSPASPMPDAAPSAAVALAFTPSAAAGGAAAAHAAATLAPTTPGVAATPAESGGERPDDSKRRGRSSVITPRGSPAPASDAPPRSATLRALDLPVAGSATPAPAGTAAAATPSVSAKKGAGRGRKRAQDDASEASPAAPDLAAETPAAATADDDDSAMSDASVSDAPSEASEGYSSEDEEGRARTQRAWRATILQLWSQIAGHKDANLFRHAVTNDIAPGYEQTVYRPMDLGQIKKLVDTGVLTSTRDFEHAVMQMFANALMFNKAGDFV